MAKNLLAMILKTNKLIDARNTIAKWVEDDLQAQYFMLVSMSNKLQKQHENMKHAIKIYTYLQDLSRYEHFMTSKELFQMRMGEGASVHECSLKMIGLIEKLSNLECGFDHPVSP
ncbi:hypothetical protein CDL12_25510 [Handroanthus impetiginosus]|uniref:Uncharacterized protein n=1 Tax=Handroanthus impetiginosus TaxID=429701 RepID=A0A2G9G9J5_9LAMI|nr:hypothetical protein CDL12_25510 [Handroanthus impetiginosus]